MTKYPVHEISVKYNNERQLIATTTACAVAFILQITESCLLSYRQHAPPMMPLCGNTLLEMSWKYASHLLVHPALNSKVFRPGQKTPFLIVCREQLLPTCRVFREFREFPRNSRNSSWVMKHEKCSNCHGRRRDFMVVHCFNL